MENAKIINNELAKKYGKDLAGRPMYRIVQNHRSLTEKRRGNFATYYGEIFIREEYGINEVPKYNYIDDGIWILEKLFYTNNPELVEKFSYEIIWAFYGPNRSYQQPSFRACEFVIACAELGPEKVLSEQDQIAKEEEHFFEMLGGKPGISDALAADAGVSYAGLNYKKE